MASQSRSAVLVSVVALLAFAALVAASKRAKQVIAGLLVIGLLVFAAVSVVSNSAGASSTFYRYQSITPGKVVGTTVESRSGTFGLIVPYMKQFPFGAGLGSTGPATGMFGGPRHIVSGESQFTFLIVEIGIPGRFDDPRVGEAYRRVIAACRKHGKFAGMGGMYTPELIERHVAMGVQLVLAGSDFSLLMQAGAARAATVRGFEK